MIELLEPVQRKVGHKEKFLERLKLLSEQTRGIKVTFVQDGNYHQCQLFADYIILRCYPKHYTLHLFGDIEHYEVKTCKYEEVQYECTHLEFISRLLRVRHADQLQG